MTKLNDNSRLRTSFRYGELKCPCCGEMLFTKDSALFLDILQEFRFWYLLSMNINSGYRCNKFNKKIGGSGNSNHTVACAIDWGTREIPKSTEGQWRKNVANKWLDLCEKYHVYGEVEFNPTWIHLAINKLADVGHHRVGLNKVDNTDGTQFPRYFSKQATFKNRSEISWL